MQGYLNYLAAGQVWQAAFIDQQAEGMHPQRDQVSRGTGQAIRQLNWCGKLLSLANNQEGAPIMCVCVVCACVVCACRQHPTIPAERKTTTTTRDTKSHAITNVLS